MSHNTQSIGLSKRNPNVRSVREAGHTIHRIGWLKPYMNVNCFSYAGHRTSSKGWLKPQPNTNCSRQTGHMISPTASFNVGPNVIFRRDCGHQAVLLPLWRARERRNRLIPHVKNVRTSLCPLSSLALFEKGDGEASHVMEDALNAGTRESRCLFRNDSCLARSHKWRGVSSCTEMCDTSRFREATHRPKHTISSLAVDTYHCTPSYPWCIATTKASTPRSFLTARRRPRHPDDEIRAVMAEADRGLIHAAC